MKLVGMVSLGCPKNLVDSETVLGLLASNGYVITSSLEEAEIIIINTCGFIRPAVQESLSEILEAAELKKHGNCRHLIVMGCLTQRYGADRLRKNIPEVDLWVGVNTPQQILDYLSKTYEEKPNIIPENLPRLITTPPSTAYLKIAEGCSHSCAYCLIPTLRGRLKSRPLEEIVYEANSLVTMGIRELILVAQDTGAYGKDLKNNNLNLATLLRRLASIPELQWVRILYLNPSSITTELIETIRSEPKVCRYLDIPVQHVSRKILRKMGRKGSAEEYLQLIKHIREQIPGIALRTTLMTGFPGEDEDDFKELLEFVEKAQFDRLGVFPYYHEEGTRSYREKETVPFFEKRKRRREILKVQKTISRKKNESMIGKDLIVLIEKKLGEGVFIGRSYREAPEIDPKIIVKGKDLSIGNFTNVTIREAYTFDLAGTSQD
ncbi:MAG: 30S ribosomal protein S12 methylthiotransferase RimO [Thermacetogeniaceae bacterium]